MRRKLSKTVKSADQGMTYRQVAKLDLTDIRNSRLIVPGPGSYRQIDTLNKTGRYLLSMIRTNRCSLFDK